MSCHPVCLVSSTPHPVRNKHLADISYNVSTVISPITQPAEIKTSSKCNPPVLSYKPKHGVAPVISKTYKRTAKKKNHGSMSCHPVCLVSSTPHPVRNKHLADISYNVSTVISPITQPAEIKTSSKCNPPVLSYKPKHGVAPVISKTYKRTAKKKNHESASSEVLRELKAKNIAVNNALSQSHNMYNMYPELVVLDSDEENVFSTIENKNNPIRKPKEAAKPRAKKLKKSNDEETKAVVLDSDEENVCSTIENKNNPIRKPKEAAKPRAKKLKKSNDEETETVNYENEHIDEPPHSTRLLRSKQIEPMKHELPLSNLVKNKQKVTQVKKEEAVQPKKQGGIGKTKCKIPQSHRSNVVCLDDESIFSDCLLPGNLSCKTKRKVMEISQLVNAISDEDNVQFTPRGRKSEVKAPDRKHLDENKNDVPANNAIGPNRQELKMNNIAYDKYLEHNKESNIILKDKKDGNEATDLKLPRDIFSCFNNIVFKHNKGSGGLVANCLQTEKLKFGYVEVEKGRTFTGRFSNITFVLLEGQVEASLMSTTQAMSPGDMLRINTGEDQIQDISSKPPPLNMHGSCLYEKRIHENEASALGKVQSIQVVSLNSFNLCFEFTPGHLILSS